MIGMLTVEGKDLSGGVHTSVCYIQCAGQYGGSKSPLSRVAQGLMPGIAV